MSQVLFSLSSYLDISSFPLSAMDIYLLYYVSMVLFIGTFNCLCCYCWSCLSNLQWIAYVVIGVEQNGYVVIPWRRATSFVTLLTILFFFLNGTIMLIFLGEEQLILFLLLFFWRSLFFKAISYFIWSSLFFKSNFLLIFVCLSDMFIIFKINISYILIL